MVWDSGKVGVESGKNGKDPGGRNGFLEPGCYHSHRVSLFEMVRWKENSALQKWQRVMLPVRDTMGEEILGRQTLSGLSCSGIDAQLKGSGGAAESERKHGF